MADINIKEFYKLASEHKKKTLESLSTATKAVRDIADLEDLTKEMKGIINKQFQAPKYLNTIEKIIFYYNRKQNITLQEIADILGFTHIYMLKISARINNKMKKHGDSV